MSAAVLQLRADERWTIASPMTRASKTMAGIVLASIAGHLLLVATAVVTTRTPPPPSTSEISVEIVQAPPPETKPAPAKAEASRQAEPQRAPAPIKLAAHPPEPLKPTPAPATPAPATPEAPKPAPNIAHAAPKASPPPPRPPAPQPAQAAARPRMEAAERKLADLRHELENLRAEQAALQAERAAQQALPSTPLRDSGLGPLPDSFQAVALPAAADGAGDAMSYQEIVFSALAKAKEIGRTKGLPGSAGVRFSIDDKGRLVDVDLVHKSGIPSLDAEALDIVRRAAPFPAPPQGAQRVFSANVTFVAEAAP